MDDRTKDIACALMFLVDLLIVAIILSSCAPRRVAPTTPTTYRATYSYWKDGLDKFTVYVPTLGAEKDAKFELCSSSYVCQIADKGRIIEITRIRK